MIGALLVKCATKHTGVSVHDFLNDFTGFMTGIAAINFVVRAAFSYFFFSVEWIELSYYVKTKDNSIFDSNENHYDKRI